MTIVTSAMGPGTREAARRARKGREAEGAGEAREAASGGQEPELEVGFKLMQAKRFDLISNYAFLTVSNALINLIEFLGEKKSRAHLSKASSNLEKLHATSYTLLGTVFHALSHGVIHFVQSVRSRNHIG